MRLFPSRAEPEKIVDQCAHRGNARRPAHQHHFVDLFRRHAGVGHRLLAGRGGALEHRLHEHFENRSRNFALIAVAVGQFNIEMRGLLS